MDICLVIHLVIELCFGNTKSGPHFHNDGGRATLNSDLPPFEGRAHKNLLIPAFCQQCVSFNVLLMMPFFFVLRLCEFVYNVCVLFIFILRRHHPAPLFLFFATVVLVSAHMRKEEKRSFNDCATS